MNDVGFVKSPTGTEKPSSPEPELPQQLIPPQNCSSGLQGQLEWTHCYFPKLFLAPQMFLNIC